MCAPRLAIVMGKTQCYSVYRCCVEIHPIYYRLTSASAYMAAISIVNVSKRTIKLTLRN